jgi:hypothetical protein
MRLPFAEQAVVQDNKLVNYLLNPERPQGHGKAEFFRRLGFDRERPDELRQALLQLARTADMDADAQSD